jgi:hypothetical protein
MSAMDDVLKKYEAEDTLPKRVLIDVSVLQQAAAELAALRTRLEQAEGALQKIKSKSEMWQAAAQSTAGTHAVPPWWNLGYIAAAALKKNALAAPAAGKE